jgi:hypothetical protein
MIFKNVIKLYSIGEKQSHCLGFYKLRRKKNVYTVLAGKPERKRQVGRSTWQNNKKVDLKRRA